MWAWHIGRHARNTVSDSVQTPQEFLHMSRKATDIHTYLSRAVHSAGKRREREGERIEVAAPLCVSVYSVCKHRPVHSDRLNGVMAVVSTAIYLSIDQSRSIRLSILPARSIARSDSAQWRRVVVLLRPQKKGPNDGSREEAKSAKSSTRPSP